MKPVSIPGAVLGTALALGCIGPAAAQQAPTVAIMPTLYFSATQQSADNVTQGLRERFEQQGYTVTGADRATSAFQAAWLDRRTHYADSAAIRFGQQAGADLVAYPRLLAVGMPMAGAGQSALQPNAVILLRILNVHTKAAIYARQIGHEFSAEAQGGMEFNLPQPVATATAAEVTDNYFARIRNSPAERRRASATRRGRDS